MCFKEIIGNKPKAIDDTLIQGWIDKACDLIVQILKRDIGEYNKNNSSGIYKKFLNLFKPLLSDGLTKVEVEKTILKPSLSEFKEYLKRDLTLSFSDEIKMSEFKRKYTYKEIITELCDNEKNLEEKLGFVKDIDINNNDDFSEIIDIVADIISKHTKKKGGEIKDRITKLQEKVTSSVKSGTYDYSSKTITLYNKTICEGCSAIDIKKYEQVFIHELFHAFHYYLFMDFKFRIENTNSIGKKVYSIGKYYEILDGKYSSSVVKESLASYFEYEYCKKYLDTYRYEPSKELLGDWHSNNIINWPYSGAKYICTHWSYKGAKYICTHWSYKDKNAGALSFFFEIMLSNFDEALKLLLGPDDKLKENKYYEIIKKK